MSNKYTMMANSAVSDKIKRSTLTNNAMRRLFCCTADLEEHQKIEVMEDYARIMRRYGYSERFRHEVMSDALRGHQNMVQAEEEGGRPVDRPRSYQQEERRERREEKGERYYRTEVRGSKMREGVFIVPPTPCSILAKAMKKVCHEELRGTGISMVVQERGGRQLGQEVGVTVPGRSRRDHCRRSKCFPCNTGQK